MQNNPLNTAFFFRTACIFEGSLVIVALIIAGLVDINPFASLQFSEKTFTQGILATLPMLLLFYVFQQLSFQAVQKIRALLLATLGPALNHCHWTSLLILASIAGFSEEVLFRGVLQPWLENSLNGLLGLLASNLIFAFVHAVTPLYAVLALLIGIYLGLSMDMLGERSLTIPIVIHSLYDFVAFLIIMRDYRKLAV
jgi:membrane protease YdiL (CAAX protease family)